MAEHNGVHRKLSIFAPVIRYVWPDLCLRSRPEVPDENHAAFKVHVTGKDVVILMHLIGEQLSKRRLCRIKREKQAQGAVRSEVPRHLGYQAIRRVMLQAPIESGIVVHNYAPLNIAFVENAERLVSSLTGFTRSDVVVGDTRINAEIPLTIIHGDDVNGNAGVRQPLIELLIVNNETSSAPLQLIVGKADYKRRERH